MNSFHKSKIDGRVSMFVGMDLHKNYLQIAVMDKKGKILRNSRIDNNLKHISRFFESINSREKPVVVMESSSVWYNIYHHLSEERKLDVVLSIPVILIRLTSSLSQAYLNISLDTIPICVLMFSIDDNVVSMITLSIGSSSIPLSQHIPNLPKMSVRSVLQSYLSRRECTLFSSNVLLTSEILCLIRLLSL